MGNSLVASFLSKAKTNRPHPCGRWLTRIVQKAEPGSVFASNLSGFHSRLVHYSARHNAFTSIARPRYWVDWLSVTLKNLFQKRWFVAILLILLAAETVILVTVLVTWFLQNQAFPTFAEYPSMQPQCYALTATEVVRNAANRTVLFDCSGTRGGGPALHAPSTFFEGPALYPYYSQVAPSFTLPEGYLELSLIYTGSCTDGHSIPLLSGQSISVSDDRTYSYCGVISNSAGKVNGFTIRWYNQSFPKCCTLSASPSRITIAAGQTASVSVMVTSIGASGGNVSLNYYVTQVSSSGTGLGPQGMFNPQNLILKPGGSNSTTFTLTIPTGDSAATYHIDFTTYLANHNPSSTSITVIVTA